MRVFDLFRQQEDFVSRSREILDGLDNFDVVKLGIYRLHRGLEVVSASVLLGEHSLAAQYFQKYIEDWKSFLSDKSLMELVFSDHGYYQDDSTATIYTAMCDGIYLSIVLGLRKEMEEMVASDVPHPIQKRIGPCENYLLDLALGRLEEAEKERVDNWQDWLEDEIVFEEDERWALAVPVARCNQEAFSSELEKWNEKIKSRILAKRIHPFTYRFSDYVLGLELVPLIFLARQYGVYVDKGLNQEYGFYRLGLTGDVA